ncbi:conserved hypothetical protein [Vibrio coralliirubri]|nr:conserved hypothetical protein [Vibrio coralliirubri]CDT57467.1 conserved hypothetical protein [Vibrio coralliirubri]CDT89410.1 conserved hypothetical protein [Vibrio coralliirubri]CDT96302.1 conserved hypothetical protein [Vibrio coralliirubri]
MEIVILPLSLWKIIHRLIEYRVKNDQKIKHRIQTYRESGGLFMARHHELV